MHGIFFSELKLFAGKSLGPEAWSRILELAGRAGRTYLTTSTYPDSEATELVRAAAQETSSSYPALLESLGQFMATDLLALYGALIRPDWKTLDVVEHTERVIHSVVRLNNPGASPPEIQATRHGPDHLTFVYRSPRRMCALAKGIIRGLARHFHERVHVEDHACMDAGAPECILVALRA